MSNQPNVVVIMSDQHHRQFMGCGKDPIIKTPAMDALAKRGTLFENAYCAFPLCCPSRMSFMTGQMPSDLQCLDNARQLDSDTLTFAHMFGASGYETVLAGRMHFNGPDQRHGFDKRIVGDVTPYVYGQDKGSLQRLLSNGPWYTGPTAAAIERSGPGACAYEQYDQIVAQRAADWITSRKSNQPFMLTVGFVLPHAPFVCSEEDFETYDALISEDDLPPWETMTHPQLKAFQEHSKLVDEQHGKSSVSKKDQRRARVAYYGMCASVDRQVKQVVDAIESAGLTQDTLIVYTSDHGEQLGEHGLWWKHSFYEGSAGVPMIFAGPGVPENRKVTQNVSLIDVGPTLLDLTGSKELPNVSGRSFNCLFKDDTSAQWHDTVFAEHLWHSYPDVLQRMVKRGPWKLNYYPGHDIELFNTIEDPGEFNNRINDPAVAPLQKELLALVLRGWDHDAIMAKQKQSSAAAGIIRDARWKCDMPEPDRPWFENQTVQNHVDTSR